MTTPSHRYLIEALLTSPAHRSAYLYDATFAAEVESVARAVAELIDSRARTALERINARNRAILTMATAGRVDDDDEALIADRLEPSELGEALRAAVDAETGPRPPVNADYGSRTPWGDLAANAGPQASIPPVIQAVLPRCPFCDHDPHTGRRCDAVIDCDDLDCPAMAHRCACSYPDPGNYTDTEPVE